MGYPPSLVECCKHSDGLSINHEALSNSDVFRHCLKVIGAFDGELFIVETAEHPSDKIHRLSLWTGEYIHIYNFNKYGIFGNYSRSLPDDHFEICSNLEDPRHPLIFWIGNNSSNMDCCNLSTLERNVVDQKNFRRGYFIIDRKKRCLYTINLQKKPFEFGSSELIISEIDIDSFHRKQILHIVGYWFNYFDFDHDQSLMIFSDNSYHTNSLDLSTGEIKKNIQKSIKFDLGTCCCRGGILTPLLKDLSIFLPTRALDGTGDNRGIIFFGYNGEVKVLSTKISVDRVLFDWSTGFIIAVNKNSKSLAIYPDNWIPTSPTWTPQTHRFRIIQIREIVKIFTMIRSLCHEHIISLLPNELLFEIFKYL